MPKGYYGFFFFFLKHCQKRVVTLALTKALAVRQTVCLYRVCFNLLVSESTKKQNKPNQDNIGLQENNILHSIYREDKHDSIDYDDKTPKLVNLHFINFQTDTMCFTSRVNFISLTVKLGRPFENVRIYIN